MLPLYVILSSICTFTTALISITHQILITMKEHLYFLVMEVFIDVYAYLLLGDLKIRRKHKKSPQFVEEKEPLNVTFSATTLSES